ncbi:MAG TPA: kelch repeat-containing protein, partial [Spirochaetia bacterium]|nr:kelch repeat-containing protein [Spirochaetia bacterium]
MNARRTYFTYFGFLFIILVIVGYSARNVLFRPWTARSWVTSATLGSRIFVFGGKNSQNDLMKDVLVVDPGANTLKRVGSQPTDLFGSSAATVDGRIYLAGGTDNRSITDRIERYDPAAKHLVPFGRLPGPRTFGGMVVSGGLLFYLGGWDGRRTSDDIIRIDPNTGSASVVAHLPVPLEQ